MVFIQKIEFQSDPQSPILESHMIRFCPQPQARPPPVTFLSQPPRAIGFAFSAPSALRSVSEANLNGEMEQLTTWLEVAGRTL